MQFLYSLWGWLYSAARLTKTSASPVFDCGSDGRSIGVFSLRPYYVPPPCSVLPLQFTATPVTVCCVLSGGCPICCHLRPLPSLLLKVRHAVSCPARFRDRRPRFHSSIRSSLREEWMLASCFCRPRLYICHGFGVQGASSQLPTACQCSRDSCRHSPSSTIGQAQALALGRVKCFHSRPDDDAWPQNCAQPRQSTELAHLCSKGQA